MRRFPPNDRALQYLVDAVSDHAIYMLDKKGHVASWNTGAERLKGYSRAEIEGQHFQRFFTLEDRNRGFPESLLEKARTQGSAQSQGWRLRKDGSRFWAMATLHAMHDDTGALIGFAKITRDMTSQREAQQAIIESEQRFRMLVEGVVDYAMYMLDPSGIITDWNRGAERMMGHRADDIVGRHFSAFFTPEDRQLGLPARALSTACTEGRFESEGWRQRKDGSRFWASAVIDPVHDETGRLIGFAKITRDVSERKAHDDALPDSERQLRQLVSGVVAGELIGFAKITRDITDKKKAEQELQRAQQQLAHAQKMEAIGQLTGGVAHDFNNLLMVVSGQTEILRNRVGEDSRAMRAVEAIAASARRGEELTRHLLSFARRQRLDAASLTVSEQVNRLRELLAASLPATVSLVVDLPDTLWPVTADASELELAVLNMAVNARDAMPEGGVLTVTADNLTLLESEGLSGDFVALSISDTGEGIAPDILAKIFDPFFTTKAIDKGTGLGLSQVYGFAQQSGGRVSVKSELGGGTTFTLLLPRALDAAAAGEDQPEPASVEGARILLVEDNPEVADTAIALLEQLGHRVVWAGNAQAALKAIAEEMPELVFSDIVMAGQIDGLGLARQLHRKHPALPILLATGYSQALQGAGSEFQVLRKPYRLQDLNRAISVLLI